ncbi:MAG: hypothetical protein J5I93_11085 [Pirellulaceae bacterium]|nr:hypothetical protein [Pirellulaceae bacterium]
MESIVRNISDIDTADRRALEHVLGQPLLENQQIIIHVLNVGEGTAKAGSAPISPVAAGALPAWCNVYEGLSDEDINQIEEVILDRDRWNRQSD